MYLCSKRSATEGWQDKWAELTSQRRHCCEGFCSQQEVFGEKGRCCSKNHPLQTQHSRGVFCWCWSSSTDSSKHEESTLAYTRIFTMALSSHSSTPPVFKACKLGTLTEKQKQKPTVLNIFTMYWSFTEVCHSVGQVGKTVSYGQEVPVTGVQNAEQEVTVP